MTDTMIRRIIIGGEVVNEGDTVLVVREHSGRVRNGEPFILVRRFRAQLIGAANGLLHLYKKSRPGYGFRYAHAQPTEVSFDGMTWTEWVELADKPRPDPFTAAGLVQCLLDQEWPDEFEIDDADLQAMGADGEKWERLRDNLVRAVDHFLDPTRQDTAPDRRTLTNHAIAFHAHRDYCDEAYL